MVKLRSALWHWLTGHEAKVTMTFISRSSDFLYILKTFLYIKTFFRIMSQYGTTFDLKINVGHCDLYFMVQWFCLISWRLFDVWISYFRIMSQCDPTLDLKINVGHCDLYFMVQWFFLISFIIFDGWGSYYLKMCLWPQNKFRSQWPIFHGPVIFHH